jgi:hypothetical protein
MSRRTNPRIYVLVLFLIGILKIAPEEDIRPRWQRRPQSVCFEELLKSAIYDIAKRTAKTCSENARALVVEVIYGLTMAIL